MSESRPDERAALVFSLQPDIARRFLERRVADAGLDELERAVRAAVAAGNASDLDDYRRAVIALESTLDRELPEWSLLSMVEGAANTSLDDGTDASARTWLDDLVAALRTWLGRHAPPPRGSHDLDRER
jgi:hypothetical protein